MEMFNSLIMKLGLTVLAIYMLKLIAQRIRFIWLLDRLPGSLAVPFLGTTIHLLFKSREEIFSYFDEIARKYKPIFRTWAGMNGEIHITSPQYLEKIMSSSTYIKKSSIYNFLHSWLGQGLLTSSGSKWHAHRKLITPTFHFKILDGFTEVFMEKSQILVKKLKKEANGKVFDIYPYITHCALDIICETAMGTPVNAQEDNESEYIAAVYKISEVIVQRMLRPWLYPNVFFYMSSLGQKYKKSLQILHTFTTEVIKTRKKHMSLNQYPNDEETKGQKKRMAFLDLLLQASGDNQILTDEEIREEVDTFMFEGHDTTSASVCWALLLLGNYQNIQECVYEEQNGIFQGSDRPATMKDLGEMKYLEMVIKETLRLYPSVPFVGRTLTQDVQLGNYTAPAGCAVVMHIYHVHRDPQQFPNPEQFDPDNFLPDRVQKRHPYAYVPFSAGPRNCIGQKFALLEEKMILSSILRNYKVTAAEKREDIKIVAELILRPHAGIKVMLEPRC